MHCGAGSTKSRPIRRFAEPNGGNSTSQITSLPSEIAWPELSIRVGSASGCGLVGIVSRSCTVMVESVVLESVIVHSSATTGSGTPGSGLVPVLLNPISVASSLMIVPVLLPPRTAPFGLLSTRNSVSSSSISRSPFRSTSTCCVSVPGRKVTTSLTGSKSTPDVAVPPSVAALTVIGKGACSESSTVNTSVFESPGLPSGAAGALLTRTVGKSSLMMVILSVQSWQFVAPVFPVALIERSIVSSSSISVSPSTRSGIVWLSAPTGRKVSWVGARM